MVSRIPAPGKSCCPRSSGSGPSRSWSTGGGFLLKAAVLLLFLSPGLRAPASVDRPVAEYVPGDVIVSFKAPVSLNMIHDVLAAHSLVLKRHYAGLSERTGKHSGLIHDDRRTTTELIAELRLDPAIESAEPNCLRRVNGRATPNDPGFPSLWALQNTAQTANGDSGTAGADMAFVAAWALARPVSGNPPVVAVIDTGVDYTHPDLVANMWTNPGEIPENGIDDDGNGYVDDVYGYDFVDDVSSPEDSGFHGTHISGTIAATGNNALGVVGVDDNARIMALRASNDGDLINTAAVIEAIQYAIMMKARGANIVCINESFGGGESNSVERAAIQAAGDAEIIFCVAAGNDGFDNDTSRIYPASYRLSNMINVAATDQNDALASFSDYGVTTVDVGAPGVNILSTYPVALVGSVATVQQGSKVYGARQLLYSGVTSGITGTVYDCGLGYPEEFPAGVNNNIALIQRGTLTFSTKVENAMAAGARAAVIYNNVSQSFGGTLQNPAAWIPALAISQSDGLALLDDVPTTATVVNERDYQYLDGTSMAAPQVSGAVAFAAMNFPTENAFQRVNRILQNVDVVPGLQNRVGTGGRLNLQRIVDTDRNGLPDWWEFEYFNQQTGTGPDGDPDSDGMSNLAEWMAGTNPTNTASNLRLSLVSEGGVGGALLSWPSVAGKSYRLDRSTNLSTGFNSIVFTNVMATPPVNTATDETVPPGHIQFYRVGVE